MDVIDAVRRSRVPAARRYWPCRPPLACDADRAEEVARRAWDFRSVVARPGGEPLLLLADDDPSERSRLRLGVLARRLDAGLVVAEPVPTATPIAPLVDRLRRVRPAPARGAVAFARPRALGSLVARLDARDLRDFVDDQLAVLRAYDRERGTDLQRVVELALDHECLGEAAAAAYMHRNTFRRNLRTALDLLDAEWRSAERRLALHLALKLRSGAP